MKQDKQAIRKQMCIQRAAMPAQQRTVADAQIWQQVQQLDVYKNAQTVFIYVSVGGEVDTHMPIEQMLAAGKKVLVPRCVPGTREMQPCEIKGIWELEPGAYGLLEPPSSMVAKTPEEIDLAIVPCVSCDTACNRLGQGGGYYDRLLAGHTLATIALCRDENLCAALPCEEWDKPMDMVVTQSQVHCRSNKSQK